jgi:hypothetical protein
LRSDTSRVWQRRHHSLASGLVTHISSVQYSPVDVLVVVTAPLRWPSLNFSRPTRTELSVSRNRKSLRCSSGRRLAPLIGEVDDERFDHLWLWTVLSTPNKLHSSTGKHRVLLCAVLFADIFILDVTSKCICSHGFRRFVCGTNAFHSWSKLKSPPRHTSMTPETKVPCPQIHWSIPQTFEFSPLESPHAHASR